MNTEYPMNLLDEIAHALHKEDWELSPPSDFEASLAYVLATLPERTAFCVTERYKNGKTYKEIGDEIGLTRERVRQIIAKALHQLAHHTRRIYLELGVQGVIERKVYLARNAEFDDRLDAVVELLTDIAGRIKDMSDGEMVSAMAKYSNERFSKQRQIPLEQLDLSVRSFNHLSRAGMHTVGDVLDTPTYDLMKVRNLGKKSLDEIKDKIHSMGLLFCDEREG